MKIKYYKEYSNMVIENLFYKVTLSKNELKRILEKIIEEQIIDFDITIDGKNIVSSKDISGIFIFDGKEEAKETKKTKEAKQNNIHPKQTQMTFT